MRHALVALLLLASSPALAAPAPPPVGLTATTSLGGGAEVGRRSSASVGELELGVGWETGVARPELGVVLGLAPGTYLTLRPGVHVALPDLPLYARAALDWSHQGGSWRARWLLAGAGGELALTSVLGAFVEADVGFPLTGSVGVGLLGRAGFAVRF